MTPHPEARHRMLRGWPAAAGILFAAGLILLLRVGVADRAVASDVLLAAAFVYLGSAALGRRSAAWPLFGLTFLIIGAAIAVPAVPAGWIIAVLALLLLGYGLFRGRVRPAWGLPAQTAILVAVLGVVLLLAPLPGPWGGVLVGMGLIGHALWDLRHLRTRRVVAPTMAEFCAGLDTALAVGVIALTI